MALLRVSCSQGEVEITHCKEATKVWLHAIVQRYSGSIWYSWERRQTVKGVQKSSPSNGSSYPWSIYLDDDDDGSDDIDEVDDDIDDLYSRTCMSVCSLPISSSLGARTASEIFCQITQFKEQPSSSSPSSSSIIWVHVEPQAHCNVVYHLRHFF